MLIMHFTSTGTPIPPYCNLCRHLHPPGAHSKPMPLNTREPGFDIQRPPNYQKKNWKDLEKEDKKFWKEIEKHDITYRGQVTNFLYLGGWHKNYSFSCERIDEFGGPIPAVGVKLRTKKDIQTMIHQGDILRLEGRLKRGKPLEPNKIYNETKGYYSEILKVLDKKKVAEAEASARK